jgi:DNA-binding protein HU-beta
MNKTEFIAAIAEKNGMTKKAAAEAVAAVTSTIVDVLKNGDEVALAGFGKFSVVDVAEREARNPQTGETMTVAAHKAPKFKFASNVKADIR